jgi:formylglycine-generating enzyme required for sulfatase activity
LARGCAGWLQPAVSSVGVTALPDDLLEARDRGLLVPFVGAGVSMAVKRRDRTWAFPDWKGLLERAAERLEANQRRHHQLVRWYLHPDSLDLLEAAKHAQLGFGAQWGTFLREQLDVDIDDIDEGTLELAKAVWGLGSQLVITTNYDRVLRWACPRSAVLTEWPILEPVGQRDALQGKLTRPAVWPLHGSISDPTGIILSPEGYASLYPSDVPGAEIVHEAALGTLRKFMYLRHLLFVGFGLGDRHLVRQLEWVHARFRGCGGPHFVVARTCDVAGMRANVPDLDLRFVCVDAFEQMPALLRLIASSKAATSASSNGSTESPSPVVVGALAVPPAPPRDPNLVVGDVLADRYELLEVAGDGGFATVWRARDRSESREVAVKVLHPQWWRDQSRVDRFCRGARAMGRLDHAGVVEILAAPQLVGHHHFFVMPWRACKDLRAAVLSGVLDRDAALRALADAIDGLAHAHDAALVHRDVKPANILVDADGRGAIADFDLVGGGEDPSQGTGTSAGMGTVMYAAPELFNDAANADNRADVYGAAMCVLFVLGGGDPPMLLRLLALKWIEGVKCSVGLRRLLWRAVAPDRHERDVTCMQLAAAVRAEVDGRSDLEEWMHDSGVDAYGRWASFRVGEVEQRMRWIEPGTFTMGSPPDEEGRQKNEGPQHEVTLTRGYWLAETPCTQALWQVVMGENPSRFRSPMRPVEGMSWQEVRHFCRRLNEQVTWLVATLPTEAQWEYACRAGTTAARYTGNLDEIAWCGDSLDGGTHEVGHKRPNQWGLHDMLGNVWEWCADAWRDYSASPVADPVGAGRIVAVRGGSYCDDASRVRASFRRRSGRGFQLINLGFRLARGQ